MSIFGIIGTKTKGKPVIQTAIKGFKHVTSGVQTFDNVAPGDTLLAIVAGTGGVWSSNWSAPELLDIHNWEIYSNNVYKLGFLRRVANGSNNEINVSSSSSLLLLTLAGAPEVRIVNKDVLPASTAPSWAATTAKKDEFMIDLIAGPMNPSYGATPFTNSLLPLISKFGDNAGLAVFGAKLTADNPGVRTGTGIASYPNGKATIVLG